jgi:hypothetical protein
MVGRRGLEQMADLELILHPGTVLAVEVIRQQLVPD